MWNEEINEARFVTSWDTTEEDIDDMIRTLDVVLVDGYPYGFPDEDLSCRTHGKLLLLWPNL